MHAGAARRRELFPARRESILGHTSLNRSVTTCLQSICGNPRFPHHLRTFAQKSAWGADLPQHFRSWYGGEPGEETWRGHAC